MAIPYTTTSYPYGSRTVTFNYGGGGTGNVILESFELSQPTWETNRTNELGVPNGFALGQEPRTANFTAQLASTVATYLGTGDTASITVRGTAVTFVINQVSDPEESRSTKKQTGTLREVI